MSKAFLIAATVLLWCSRLFFVWLCFVSGELSVQLVGAVELVALAAGAVNVIVAKQWDTSAGSWVVVVHYFTVFLIVPQATSSWPLVPLSLARLACILYMGAACTIGGLNWVGLVDRGPFAYVRHPLMAITIASRLAMALTWLSPWNLAIVGFHVAWSLVDLFFEERWLATREEWRRYAMRVPYRLLPGVW